MVDLDAEGVDAGAFDVLPEPEAVGGGGVAAAAECVEAGILVEDHRAGVATPRPQRPLELLAHAPRLVELDLRAGSAEDISILGDDRRDPVR
ncbi:MAG TPA: hypothetical protein VM487_12590 [Phycisphaerae bacterium]|nr:hypothetical protein [Phycisphaerae bacterium]